ncbi:MAG TPA: DUF255 domain-containing protein, partial [Planctomycetota bacterium]|nr:DUF255 domain-containing protein [Planctomycetota bacterium]
MPRLSFVPPAGILRPALLVVALLTAAAPAQHDDARATSAPASRPAWRLAGEKSLYLRLHADDAVRWYPWGDEALAEARRLGRPIFLSSGYASCHWCHVMARESFRDPAVAALLDARFVCVKLDREERPDVDRVYLEACVNLTGRGGWPLTVFLTPDGLPFYATTYVPPDGDEPGFGALVRALGDVWAERRDEVEASAEAATEAFSLPHLSTRQLDARIADLERRRMEVLLDAGAASRPASGADVDGAASRPESDAERLADRLRARIERLREARAARATGAPTPDGAALLARCAARLLALEDVEHGGFGFAPKFPAPLNLLALLRDHARRGGEATLAAVRRQLAAMERGALRDHLGGGWHRYATDRRWTAPHYEKMLYDQALLASAYLEAWRTTGDAALAARVRETLDFCLETLRRPDGLFAAALDAESGGVEGAWYLWTRREIDAALAPDDAAALRAWAGFDAVERDEPQSLAERVAPEVAAAAIGAPLTTFQVRLARGKATLRERRAARPPPARVDHALAGWNALTVSALADAGLALGVPRYVDAAIAAMDALDARMRRDDGLYARRSADGEARFLGELSDQAAI